jgi:hypothetical protein
VEPEAALEHPKDAPELHPSSQFNCKEPVVKPHPKSVAALL